MLVDKIMAYENGDLDDDSTIDLFQQLINDGTVWSLQGHYGRLAAEYIHAGICTASDEVKAMVQRRYEEIEAELKKANEREGRRIAERHEHEAVAERHAQVIELDRLKDAIG